MFVNWRATLVVFVFPTIAVRFLMMAGNWGQHAFIDAATPEVPFRNSITCLAARYHRRCFNDGYHIGPHVRATRHWTEMPADFEASRAAYARERAIVFEGIDYFGVWWLLMWRSYAKAGAPLCGPDRAAGRARARSSTFCVSVRGRFRRSEASVGVNEPQASTRKSGSSP